MAQRYDVIVVGVGGMGSAAAYHLARRGRRVLGVERFDIPDEMGSSHGGNRVIRKAYFEDPRYVPLLHRAYELWGELETQAGEKLLHVCGGLNIGPADHPCIAGVRESVAQHGLAHEVLTAEEIQRRFPALRPGEGDIGIYEADAGFVLPERCVLAHVEQARRLGAEIQAREAVREVRPGARSVTVATERGEYDAETVVVSAGAWLGSMLEGVGTAAVAKQGGFGLPLRVERQVQCWFEPVRAEECAPGRLPVFIQFFADRSYYGLPHFGRPGVKVCRHHGGATVTAETVDRTVSSADEEDVRGFVRAHLPAADGRLLSAKVCLYTNTPDEHFVIGRHPAAERVMIVSACSGHGFKFSAVVGEIVADLIVDGRSRHEIGMFAPGRFGAGG